MQVANNRSQTSRADDQRAVGIRQGVVGAGVARRDDGVVRARSGRTLRGAAIGQGATQIAQLFIVHKARTGHPCAAAVGQRIVSLAVVVGGDGQRHRGDDTVAAAQGIAGQVGDAVGQHIVARISAGQGDVGDGVGHRVACVLGCISTRAACAHAVTGGGTRHAERQAAHGRRAVIGLAHAAIHRSRHWLWVDLQSARERHGVAVVGVGDDAGCAQLVGPHIELATQAE